ncbi:MAG: DNA (cytosine-5-)-methyltransferase, partial [Planctomycetales bacterium]
MKAVDLFAGCGGMSAGFSQAGFSLRAAYEYWEPAAAIYRVNFPDHPVFPLDLSDVDEAREHVAQWNADLIIGGPPCQDFSSAGKRDESLGRANLTVAFAEIIRHAEPRWFVMENVQRARSSNAYAEARKVFRDSGYGLTEAVLDASLCGAPQKRKRLFVVGERGGENGAVESILARNQAATRMTPRDYFGDALGIDHYYRHPRSYQRRAIFSIDEPSPTVRGVNRPVPPNYAAHPGDRAAPKDVRPLTTRERAMIQTFPEA